ncbi:Allergen Cr-PI [Blattella germanica]|nr:Allergen Cr-PI [Blattella germanica]
MMHAGKNAIERNSHESTVVAKEQDTPKVLYKKVNEAYEGKATYNYDKQNKFCGLPEHLLIPKGKKGGQAFTVYVIVTPYDKAVEKEEHHFKAYSYCGVGPHDSFSDEKPLGFPFDRPIHSYDFVTPNMFMKDVFIFHKKYEEVEQH